MSNNATQTDSLAEQYKIAIDVATIASKTDLKGRITYVNDEFCRVCGYTREELLGRPHNIVRHPDMPKEAFRQVWQTIQAKKPWTGIVKNKGKSGNVYWVNTTIVPIINPQTNEIAEYISIRSNITETVESKSKIEQLLAASKKFVPEDMLALQGVPDITHMNVNSGKIMDMSILFSDIQGFTTMSETKEPDILFTELNEFFSAMEPFILENNGIIDKYIGDSIMVIFEKATDAIRAGLSMRKRLVELNARRGDRGLPNLKIGIGIHSGKIILGTVGTERRMDATVIGDTVNTASRIEHLTRKVNRDFLISEHTLAKAGGGAGDFFTTQRMGKILLRGKSNAMHIHAVL